MAEDEFETKPSLLDAFGSVKDEPPASVPAAPTGALIPVERMGAIKCEVMRDDQKILQKIKALAAHAGEEWYYRWSVKDKKTGKLNWVEGLTIKGANDLWRIYGNCDINCDVVDVGDSWLIKARFFDKETGSSMARVYQQRKSQMRSMGEDAERQRDIALQIGVSKAIRNVVTNSLQSISDFAFEEARNSLVSRVGKDLPRWRENTAKKLESKIDLKRAEAVMGRTVGEWLAPDIAQLLAMMKTVSDGMATLDETFPPLMKQDEDKKETAIEQFAEMEERQPGQEG